MHIRIFYGECSGIPAILVRHKDGRSLAFKYENDAWGYISPDDVDAWFEEIGGGAFLRRWPWLRLPNIL